MKVGHTWACRFRQTKTAAAFVDSAAVTGCCTNRQATHTASFQEPGSARGKDWAWHPRVNDNRRRGLCSNTVLLVGNASCLERLDWWKDSAIAAFSIAGKWEKWAWEYYGSPRPANILLSSLTTASSSLSNLPQTLRTWFWSTMAWRDRRVAFFMSDFIQIYENEIFGVFSFWCCRTRNCCCKFFDISRRWGM